MEKQSMKVRYGIIGNNLELDRALSIAVQVAVTDMSILITGESGVGKDIFSKIIHENSSRKHNKIISVNCGAIPEGTIESELFGHVKGAFTSADKDRKGYFEEADKGTIFLDEIGELPMPMQAKLLRVLESGELIRVGSSDIKKVNVRVIAATNVDMVKAILAGKFREDLYFRLNQISIYIPPLRERKDDIYLLFRKFASDIADKYKMPSISLANEAKEYLINYPWYGNIRELKNITEQISIIENERIITKEIVQKYLHYDQENKLPTLYQSGDKTTSGITDRELLLKALSMGQMINEMRSEINDLKNTLSALAQSGISLNNHPITTTSTEAPTPSYIGKNDLYRVDYQHTQHIDNEDFQDTEVIEDEPLALSEREKSAIRKALEKHNGKRKLAATDLKISERTLYRKLKEYGIE